MPENSTSDFPVGQHKKALVEDSFHEEPTGFGSVGLSSCTTFLGSKLLRRKSWADVNRTLQVTWHADSLRGRFARGAIWSFIGAIAAQGSNLAASVITARLLGQVDFGQYGIIQSTVGMLGLFAGLGLGITATKYVAEFRTRDPERAGRIISLGSLVAVISGGLLAISLVIFAPTLAMTTLGRPELASGLRIASVLLFFNAANGAQSGALAGLEAFRTIARINIARGLVAFPLTVIFVFLWGLPGAIWALSATSAVACILSRNAIKTYSEQFGIRVDLFSGWAEHRVLWTFSTPAVLSGALAGPAIWAANAMLVNQPGGYAEMGVFSAASQWRNAIGFVPVVLTQIALPLLSNLNGERDTARYGRALRWNLIITALAAGAVAIPVGLAAPLIMRLYGRGFERGWPVLVLSAVTAVMSCVNGVIGTAIISSGSVWVGFLFNALWAGVLIVGCYYLMPGHPALGLAQAMLIAYAAHTLWQTLYLRRHLSQNCALAPERTAVNIESASVTEK